MGNITIQVVDATGNKNTSVEVPDNVPVNRILAVLADRLSLPRNAPDGQPMVYKFHHKNSGRQLIDSKSLAESGVLENDVIRIMPEITAGSLLNILV